MVWKSEIPWYFFTGGLAGASSTMSALADLAGDHAVAKIARRVAAGGALASPVLLVADLGVPSRFLNMLRVFKVTSPMNTGSWVLTVYAPAAVGAAVLREVDTPPVLAKLAEGVAAVLGPVLATYTAGLVADTAVPAWHDARHTLPFSFAGGSTTSAGALAAALLPPASAASARRVALAGAALEGAATIVMERRLGELGRPYHEGRAGRLNRGGQRAHRRRRRLPGHQGTTAPAGCHRRCRAPPRRTGVPERWAVFRAGFQSAQDPRHTVVPQRRRLEERPGPGTATPGRSH